ncbi:MAG: hypothetical protein J0I33_07825 [Microbacterium ginsengisoli]|jgi:hypothetical protein|uniref:hypothetical protein n=1 Tax=Microbacterium TaxID=33882 RepID=UPI0007021EB6|nr:MULTISPECIES: hypothetical protein [unclassified Microbacterium]KQR97705.1 hypothetical protein ASF93_13330 [Microbacterium sp. Leaf347]KQS01729.1 hypothetical protein ASG00_09855 [Microbacterium sp. Leaf351]MBN9198532.1 hypothetical protein [Microbacterium ginsengisoli]OJU78084.1 MAG: hypothetical protein BGO15_02470 [Microbacterium sp. 71-23]
MVYIKVRPGGWRQRPYISTSLDAAALDHFEQGIYDASVTADGAFQDTPEGRTALAASTELGEAFVGVANGVTATITGDPADPDVRLFMNGVEL